MATKKDMRRADLFVPYVAPPQSTSETDVASTLSTTLPMVAIVSRNKLLGWTAVVFAVQSWLAETPAQKAKSSTPGYFGVAMAFMAVVVSYMPLFFPPLANRVGSGTGTEAPPAVPPA